MSRPHHKPYSKTVFIAEGIKTAIVVTAIGSRLSKSERRFASPETALSWCRKHRASLVYSPAEDPSHN